jgi:hypothetical protein
MAQAPPAAPAQCLVGVRHAQHADIVETMPDDLQPDRQAVGVVAGADRAGRLLRHVERRREGAACGEVASKQQVARMSMRGRVR